MRLPVPAAALFALASALPALPAPPDQPANLGRIDFPTSASAAAQKSFVRGVLLLHSFMYDDAAEEFQAAQKAEPGFALAYWGEAMTRNHPLWMQRDAEGARQILARLAPSREARLAKAKSKRERGYLDAVEELYAEGEKRERDLAYAEAMRRLFEDNPNDLESKTFYALALLGSCEDHRDFAVYMKGAALAEEVFAKNPDHPGAVHYLIHAYDDPVHAPLGLRPARVYAKIAGSAPHALHMPSHIFFALGMWDDVIASNEASWKAADERVARRRLGADERGWHGIYWREYALLQQGRRREARALLAIAEQDAKGGLDRVVSARNEMRAAWAVETDCAEWTAPAEAPRKTNERFIRGFCAARRGDAAGLSAAIDSMTEEVGKEPAEGAHSHGRTAGGGAAYGAGASSGKRASIAGVLRMELEALALLGKGDGEAAAERARQAAAAEDSMSFDFGPPAIVKPAHELLGEILAARRMPAEAEKEFHEALSHAPGRARSLSGLIDAGTAAHDDAAVAEARKTWEVNRRRADRPAADSASRAPAP